MLPPSPRKIRAGGRGCTAGSPRRRRPGVKASAASSGVALRSRPARRRPAADDRGDRAAAPSRLSIRLKALTSPTTQTIVSSEVRPPRSRTRTRPRPALPERGRRRDLGEHARQRAEADPVVERPDERAGRRAQDDRPAYCDGAAAAEHGAAAGSPPSRPRRRGTGVGPAVLLVADRPVEEVGAPREPDRHRDARSAPRRGRGRRRARAAAHPASRASSLARREARRVALEAITSSIASSTVRVGSQPVSSRSAVVSGRRRPSSSNPSS